MLNSFEIKSNTKGKIQKMIKGVVYSDPLVFVNEFFQNTQRAKASRVEIVYDKVAGIISFTDNGVGLKKAEDILTLDYSNWATTDEGFGVGFWSWLGVRPMNFDFESDELAEVVCEVISNNIRIRISRDSLILEDSPEASVEKTSLKQEGFSVTLSSELFKDTDYYLDFESRIFEEGALLPIDVFFNGQEIEKVDILSKCPEGIYSEIFERRYFRGKLCVSKSPFYSGEIELYYENRFVKKMYFGEISGVLELKKGALSLREPDRKDYSFDSKYNRLVKALEACQKTLYLNFLKNANANQIKDFSRQIDSVLEVKDYEKYISLYKVISSETNENTHAYENTDNLMEDESGQIGFNLESDNLSEAEYIALKTSHEFNSQISRDKFEAENNMVVSDISFEEYADDMVEEEENISSTLRKMKKTLWVSLEEVELCSEAIAQAEYYGVKVIRAKHILHEKVLAHYGIPHIRTITENLKKENVKKNITIRNKKEERIMQLLIPICDYYNLPESTFRIADLELTVELRLDGNLVFKDRKKNEREKFVVYGLSDGTNIYLDRKALMLNSYQLTTGSSSLGKHDYKALLRILPTVAHELAHHIYKTTDNTIFHFAMERKIQDEIIENVFN